MKTYSRRNILKQNQKERGVRMRQKGFTLIELMITVAVLGVLAAISLPSFQSIIEKRRLVGAADNLTAALQYARSEAIKQNQTVRFQFNTASWCVGVDDDLGSDCDCTTPSTCTIDTVQKIVSGSDYPNVDLAVAPEFNDIYIDFDPRQGLPNDSGIFAGGDFTLDINGQSKKVCLNVIGRIKIIDGAAACN